MSVRDPWTMNDEIPGFHPHVSAAARGRHGELAELCRLARNAYFKASATGFYPAPRSEAHTFDYATQAPTWPGGPWPAGGPTASLHKVGLMLSNAAAGRIGEMGALLAAGEVFWGLPGNARGVLELVARLFRIHTQPFLPFNGAQPTPEVIKKMFATAHREIFDAAFSSRKLVISYRDLDPGDQARQDTVDRADANLTRLTSAYGPLYDQASTNLISAHRLEIGGVGHRSMTELIDDMTEWMWPDPTARPRPLYKVFSGHAHGSLDADAQLYRNVVQDGQERLTRQLPEEFIESSVATAAVMFQGVFARLTGFYNWEEAALHEFSERLAVVVPSFTYG